MPYGSDVRPGDPYPVGATVSADGVNFSVFSANATAVDLLLFDRYDQPRPTQVIPLSGSDHRTYYYWHAFVPGLADGQIYGYRASGPYAPERRLRFCSAKVLLDPYARAVAYGDNWSRAEAHGIADNTASALKSVVVDLDLYDWQGDRPLKRPLGETVLYELHVGGFTRHPSSNVACPGTFLGLVDKIPYLLDLGVTGVELLPVQQYDPQEVRRANPITGEPLSNYWGYAPVAYFAPHHGYGCSPVARDVVDEFRDMVKAFHRAGLEVILDVVFNHTAEGGAAGPTISFRGLEDSVYYMLYPDGGYRDYTGTGNTVNCNNAIVRRLMRECLRYWVRDMHVDGFRFDLASVLSRDTNGDVLRDSPILWEIEADPMLAGAKLIAEAWDASGLYQLGGFTGDRWTEWNGRFRDDIRRFVRGDADTVRDLGWRLTGSFDVFRSKRHYVSSRSINFVTSHDGFTLADLVSYNAKHNEANGEADRDGMNENWSWNCGVEGPTDEPSVVDLRRRQMRNLVSLLLLSRGTPMLLSGDEFGRTQMGNNNAYCQDNEVSWLDWRMLASASDLHRFVRGLVHLRRAHPTLRRVCARSERFPDEDMADAATFHGVALDRPDWSDLSHSLAVHLLPTEDDAAFYLIANAFHEPLRFLLPSTIAWKRLVDTALPTPLDWTDEEEAPLLQEGAYTAGANSLVLLMQAIEPAPSTR